MNLFEVKEAGGDQYQWLELYPTDEFVVLLNKSASDDELLDLSIKKWEFIVEWLEDEKNTDRIDDFDDCGGLACALCQVHMNDDAGYCEECPVLLAGYPGCGGTPYEEFQKVGKNADRLFAAKQEVAFLKKVRKEHGKNTKSK